MYATNIVEGLFELVSSDEKVKEECEMSLQHNIVVY